MPQQESLAGAPHTVGVRSVRGDLVDESQKEIGTARIHAIAGEAADAGLEPLLPEIVRRQFHAGGPARDGAGRQFHGVPLGFVGAAALFEHARQHRHIDVGVIVHAHFALAFMQAMQTPDILRDGASPGNGHGQKKRVEARLVEALPDESTRGQHHLRPLRSADPRERGRQRLRAHPAAERDDFESRVGKATGKRFKMLDTFGQHQRRASGGGAVRYISADRRIARLVRDQLAAEAMEFRAGIGLGVAARSKPVGRTSARRENGCPTVGTRPSAR